MIDGLRDLGKTVFLTTHYMDEAQALADRVAVIADGRIVAAGTPDELGGRERGGNARSASRLPPGVEAGRAAAGDRRRERPAATERVRRSAAPSRRRVLNELTSWALARADRARRARGPPSEPRGRLPGADRGRRAMSALALVRPPVPLRPEGLLAQPGGRLLHGDVPGDLPAASSRRSSATTRSRSSAGSRSRPTTCPGSVTLAVVSATLVNVAMRMVEMRESGRLKRVRGTPLPTWAFIAGRIGNAFVVSLLMVVIVTAIGRDLLRRRGPDDDAAGAARHAARRHLRLLLPRLRAERGDPERGRRAGDHELHGAAALLPLRRLHPGERDPRRRPRLRRPVPDPPLLRGASSTAFDPLTDRRRLRVGSPGDRRRSGASPASLIAARTFSFAPRDG